MNPRETRLADLQATSGRVWAVLSAHMGAPSALLALVNRLAAIDASIDALAAAGFVGVHFERAACGLEVELARLELDSVTADARFRGGAPWRSQPRAAVAPAPPAPTPR